MNMMSRNMLNIEDGSKNPCSACLLGHPVRYNGKAKTFSHLLIEQWQQEGRLVSVCPELSAGFSIPRPPAEIANLKSGQEVLSGDAHIYELTGNDVTEAFIKGARIALDLALRNGCRYAFLTDGSPSCGSRFIYTGDFTNRMHSSSGMVAALLRANGIEVFSENEIESLQEKLR